MPTCVARECSHVRHEEIHHGQDMSDQDSHLLPSINFVCSISVQSVSIGPAWSRTKGSQWRLSSLHHPGVWGNSSIPEDHGCSSVAAFPMHLICWTYWRGSYINQLTRLYSLPMNGSCIGAAPLARVYVAVLLLSFVLAVWQHRDSVSSIINHSLTIISSSSCSSLPQGLHLLVSVRVWHKHSYLSLYHFTPS